MSNLQIMNIQGIDCYEKDGTAYLKLENVARGLGFTTVATSGNECVRWNRVYKYLEEFGVPTCGDDGFIPENIFYRLAMKAKNEVAERFQAKIADEVIPSIRKHGAYMTPDKIEEVLTSPDTIIKLATQLKEERQARIRLEEEVEKNKHKVLFADSVSASSTSIPVGDLAKLIKQNGYDIGQNRLFAWMRHKGFLIKNGARQNIPTQRAMDMGLFQLHESTVTDIEGNTRIVRTAHVTGKGQVYFVNCFLEPCQIAWSI